MSESQSFRMGIVGRMARMAFTSQSSYREEEESSFFAGYRARANQDNKIIEQQAATIKQLEADKADYQRANTNLSESLDRVESDEKYYREMSNRLLPKYKELEARCKELDKELQYVRRMADGKIDFADVCAYMDN